MNHPSNGLLTKDACELNSLFRQDPRRHPRTKPLCAALPAPWAVCVRRCAAIMDTITDTAVFPAAVGPRHRKLTLVLHFFPAELPPPCGAFCTSERTWLLKEKYRLCSARALTKLISALIKASIVSDLELLMHFKNEALPTANPYTPAHRSDQVEIPATECSASLHASDVSQDGVPLHQHTPARGSPSNPCVSRQDIELMSSATCRGRTSS